VALLLLLPLLVLLLLVLVLLVLVQRQPLTLTPSAARTAEPSCLPRLASSHSWRTTAQGGSSDQ
jgi:hypothetical protein